MWIGQTQSRYSSNALFLVSQLLWENKFGFLPSVCKSHITSQASMFVHCFIVTDIFDVMSHTHALIIRAVPAITRLLHTPPFGFYLQFSCFNSSRSMAICTFLFRHPSYNLNNFINYRFKAQT